MIALLQKVTEASVSVNQRPCARIGSGLLVLWGVERGDQAVQIGRLVERVAGYRIFEDDDGRMNRSVVDVDGAVLMVPQFTLAADTRRGMRPGFSTAAEPNEARRFFDQSVDAMKQRVADVQTGEFGAHMAVSLVNDGPATFWLQVPPGV